MIVYKDQTFITSTGKPRQGFYIDEYMVKNLDFLKTMVHHKWDGVGIVCGQVGSGKTTVSQAYMKYLDPSFNLDRIVFSGEELMIAIDKATKGQGIIFDEAVMALSCQPKGSQVLMADGDWKSIENIKIGDTILSPQKNGTYVFSKVKNTCNWLCNEVYDVYSSKKKGYNHKLLYKCSHNHLIPVTYGVVTNLRTPREISKLKSRVHSYASSMIKKYMGRTNCVIEPYSLGAFIGNGCFSITKSYGRKSKSATKYYKKKNIVLMLINYYSEVMEEVSKHYPYMNTYQPKGNKAIQYKYSRQSSFLKILSKYGYAGVKAKNKFIPKEALLSDSKYRLKLLAGLIDTDGCKQQEHYYVYYTSSEGLAKDVYKLIKSLGFRCSGIKYEDKMPDSSFAKGSSRIYNIGFNCGNVKIPIKVKRKMQDLRVKSHMIDTSAVGIKVRKNKHSEIVYGLELDSDSRLYITDNWMQTHNSQDFATDLQRALIKKFTLIRSKNLYIFLIIPNFFMMRKWFCVDRTKYMLYTYSPDGLHRGYVKFYSWNRKKDLYLRGYKYMNMSAVPPNFSARFTNTEGLFIDPVAYEKKKEEAIRKITESTEKKGKEKLIETFKDKVLLMNINNKKWKESLKDKYLGKYQTWREKYRVIKAEYDKSLGEYKTQAIDLQKSADKTKIDELKKNYSKLLYFTYLKLKEYWKFKAGEELSMSLFYRMLEEESVAEGKEVKAFYKVGEELSQLST